MNSLAYVPWYTSLINRANNAGTAVFVGWLLDKGLVLKKVRLLLLPDVVTAQQWNFACGIAHQSISSSDDFSQVTKLHTARPAAGWTTSMLTTFGPLEIDIPLSDEIDDNLRLVVGVESNLAGNFCASLFVGKGCGCG